MKIQNRWSFATKVFAVLLLVVLGFFEHSNAQSGLAFSQVLLVDNQVQTVPAGKVWKMESIWSFTSGVVNSNCSSVANALDYGRAIEVNSVVLFPVSATQTGSSGNIFFSGEVASFPYWVPAGTTVRSYCPGSQISILEFSIVP